MKKYIIFAVALLMMSACDKVDLKETIYQDDSDYPGLAVYSELGYNTFGAYLNNQVFSIPRYGSNRPFYLVADREGLSLNLYGEYAGHELNMTFNIPLDSTFILNDYHDLLALDGQRFNIDTTSTNCTLLMDGYYTPTIESIYSGWIRFEKIQQVIVDKEDEEVIVAGKFQFRAFTPDGTRLDVVGGRFDLGVDETNFVNFRQ